MRLNRPLSIVAAGGAAAVLCGCPNPNTYTVPRTLDPGKVQVSLAPEAYGFSFKSTTTSTTGPSQTTTVSGLVPMVPSVGVRVGVADGFELGGRLPNLDTVALDGKVRLLKGPLDLAIDPGLQLLYLTASTTDSSGNSTSTALGVFYFHLPILLGWNVSDAVTLVLSPGAVYTVATGSSTITNDAEAAGTSTGIMARVGVGVDFRVSKKLAIHPDGHLHEGVHRPRAAPLRFRRRVQLRFAAELRRPERRAPARADAAARPGEPVALRFTSGPPGSSQAARPRGPTCRRRMPERRAPPRTSPPR